MSKIAEYQDITVYEISHGYIAYFKDGTPLERSYELGDGVDMYFRDDDLDDPIPPGTGEFEQALQGDLENGYNLWMEAYFPDAVKIAIIEYDAGGDPVSDFELETVFLDIVTTGGHFAFSTENIIHYVRLCVATGAYQHDDFAFAYSGKLLFMNEYGIVEKAPLKFACKTMELSEQAFVATARRRLKEVRSHA